MCSADDCAVVSKQLLMFMQIMVSLYHPVYPDPFPWWRLVAWAGDCSMVGVAHSSGAVEVFNTLATSLFTIYPPR